MEGLMAAVVVAVRGGIEKWRGRAVVQNER